MRITANQPRTGADPLDPMFTKSVIITGVDLPMWDLVVLQVKLALASLPAMFILLVIAAAVFNLLRGVFAR